MGGDSDSLSPPLLESLKLPSFGAPASSGPIIIAIEGPNGAGKTTLSHALARKLAARRCLGTDEEWFAEQLKVRMIRDADWYASAMFFLSGCFEQNRLLRKRSDPLIIMDRSLWSTLAVHAAQSTTRIEMLLAMLRPIASHVEVPQLTLILEASFGTCQSRIANKSGTARDLDELTATSDFHQREREFYRWLATQTSGVVFVDADKATGGEVADHSFGAIVAALPAIRQR